MSEDRAQYKAKHKATQERLVDRIVADMGLLSGDIVWPERSSFHADWPDVAGKIASNLEMLARHIRRQNEVVTLKHLADDFREAFTGLEEQ